MPANNRILSSCLLLLFAAQLSAETYIYQEKDGTRWITDRIMDPDAFQFIDKYGRPTATKSCKGVTESILQRRASLYMPAVKRFSSENELDEHLIKAIIRAESCFDRRAISRAGAHGLMQLMPSTARNYGVIDRFDATQNLRAGIKHFSELMQKYRNNTKLSLAAYNAGVHNVKRYNGIPPFRETQNYVKKVLRFFDYYKEHEKTTASTHSQ
jgi:soluble lytic murein transglycosylase-like protein